MAFLDQLWGDVQNNLSGQHSALAQNLLSALGGEGRTGQANGLTALVSKFQQAGLDHIVQSWISNEQANKEVTPDQVHKALGEEHVQKLAEQSGLPKQALLVQLAALLPQLVNALTPNGQVPTTPSTAGQTNQPGQAPGEAESPPASRDTSATAAKAVQGTDPTEPTQSQARSNS